MAETFGDRRLLAGPSFCWHESSDKVVGDSEVSTTPSSPTRHGRRCNQSSHIPPAASLSATLRHYAGRSYVCVASLGLGSRGRRTYGSGGVNRCMEDAYRVVRAWGFTPDCRC